MPTLKSKDFLVGKRWNINRLCFRHLNLIASQL